jgi:hypothetical protein
VLAFGPYLVYALLALWAATDEIELEPLVKEDDFAGGCMLIGAISLFFPPAMYFFIAFFGFMLAQNALEDIRSHSPGGVKVVP